MPKLKLTEDQAHHFWSKVDVPSDPNACWIWIRPQQGTGGYGRYYYQGRQWYAHRFAWAWLVGPIPDGMVLDHHVCHNPACINPRHLEVVTLAENSRRVGNSIAVKRSERRPRMVCTGCGSTHAPASAKYHYCEGDDASSRERAVA